MFMTKIKEQRIKKIALQIFENKNRDQIKLARIPIKKKIEILVQLQKIAVGVLPKSKQRIARKMIWKLS